MPMMKDEVNPVGKVASTAGQKPNSTERGGEGPNYHFIEKTNPIWMRFSEVDFTTRYD